MITDHEGNEFNGVREMYLHYGLTESFYYQRKRQGMPLQQILTTPRRKQINSCIDDTLVYKRHHRERTNHHMKPVKLKAVSDFRLEHGTVTVKEYWRG